MKIRYLSLSNHRYSPNYFPFLRDYVRTVASPDTDVELVGVGLHPPGQG